MKKTKLIIQDQVNIKFEGLDPVTRRNLTNKVKYFIPHARHLPAYKLGRWDGTISFCNAGAQTYLNLIDVLLPIVYNEGYEVELIDKRTIDPYSFKFDKIDNTFLEHKTWPKDHKFEFQPIKLNDHQVLAINNFLENPHSIQKIATGAGKTIITAALSLLCEKYGRTAIIVPNIDLVLQTEEDYKNIGLDVGVYFGNRKELNKTHTIFTWQSLSVLAKTAKGKSKVSNVIDSEAQEILNSIKDIVSIIVDETHIAKGEELKKLLSNEFSHVPIRWGLTGTVPKEDYNYITIKSVLGPIVGEISSSELQEKGILSTCKIEIIQTQENKQFQTYPEEKKFLTTNKDRLNWLVEKINELALENGNTLVLVEHIETGDYLHEYFGPESSWISGKVKSKDRKEAYKEVHSVDNKIIIATYGVAAVGINIPRLYNVILIEPGKGFVRVMQSIGRGLRKAVDKDHVMIYDICSKCKYSSRHLTERKKMYKEENYPFNMTKIEY